MKLQPETAEQIALIDWIKFQYPWLLKHTIHIPNERKCTKIYGFILKRMGLLKGASDLFIALPNSEYHGLFIEMKSAKGRPTPEQKEFIQLMNDTGYFACICYSAVEAIAVIKDYLNKIVKK